jgi:hypothetical protein
MSDIIELHLTGQQEKILAPIVREAVAARRYVLFLATAAPDKSMWRFQVVSLPPTTASKIGRLIRTEQQKREADQPAR